MSTCHSLPRPVGRAALSAFLLALLQVGTLYADTTRVVGDVPAFEDEVFVIGDAPLREAVRPGEAVTVRFGVGELDVVAAPVREVIAHIEVRCPPRREKRCGDVRKRLRIEPKRSKEGLEVRLGGVRQSVLKRLDVSGTVEVPIDSPLAVQIGIGEARVEAGPLGASVRMKIGDLRVSAPAPVAEARVRTRIGDASVRLPDGRLVTRRKKLIGAGASWSASGSSPAEGSVVEAQLRIGDARVVVYEADAQGSSNTPHDLDPAGR